MIAHQLGHRRRHFGGDTPRRLGELDGIRFIGEQPFPKAANRQMSERRERCLVMGVDDEPGHVIGLIGDERVFQERLQRNVCQAEPRRNAFFIGVRRDSSQLITGPKRARLGQERAQVGKFVSMSTNQALIGSHGSHRNVEGGGVGWRIPPRRS